MHSYINIYVTAIYLYSDTVCVHFIVVVHSGINQKAGLGFHCPVNTKIHSQNLNLFRKHEYKLCVCACITIT